MKSIFISLLTFLVGFTQHDAMKDSSSRAEITAGELRQHVRSLASDELAGRKTGEEGNRAAAKYIGDLFAKYDLKPMGDDRSFFQSFPFLASIHPGKKNELSFSGQGLDIQCTLDKNYRPVSISAD